MQISVGLRGGSQERLGQIISLGILIGIALANGDNISLPLATYVLDQLYSQPDLSLTRLEEHDSDLARNLKWVIDNDATDLDMCCSIAVTDVTGQRLELDAMRDPPSLIREEAPALTNANKAVYAERVARFRLFEQHRVELVALKAGLETIDPEQCLSVFSAGELQLLINGQTRLDVAEWEKHTVYSGYSRKSPVSFSAGSFHRTVRQCFISS